MRSLCLSAVLAVQAGLAQAEPDEDGLSLMEEGARLFLRGILEEMEPALDDLRGLGDDLEPALRQFVLEMGPALKELLGSFDGISQYHAPELLPNGDILLRRKAPAEPAGEGDAPQDQIDL
ncbi:MAG: hypothetical protein JXR13_11910 [Thalassovita sp.]